MDNPKEFNMKFYKGRMVVSFVRKKIRPRASVRYFAEYYPGEAERDYVLEASLVIKNGFRTGQIFTAPSMISGVHLEELEEVSEEEYDDYFADSSGSLSFRLEPLQ